LLTLLALVVTWFAAIYALARGRLGWARIANRGQAGAALAATSVLMVAVGSALPEPTNTDTVAGQAGNRPAAIATTSPPDTPAPTPSPTAASAATTPAPKSLRHLIAAAPPRTALAVLGTLQVEGRAPKTGYDRDAFGQAWADTDRNGCDTRNDILRRDLAAATIEAGTDGCDVLAGDRAPDPYTGKRVRFVRGGASEIDIDHVVALGDA